MFKQIAGFAAATIAASLLVRGLDSYTGASHRSADTPGAYNSQSAKPSQPQSNGQRITAITADANGHFSVAVLVNGTHVEMLADTGASKVVLTDEDAQRAGFDRGWLKYDVKVNTANGSTKVARVTLDEVRVGSITLNNVDALVARPGDLGVSLLGMSFIGGISRFELRGNQLVLVE